MNQEQILENAYRTIRLILNCEEAVNIASKLKEPLDKFTGSHLSFYDASIVTDNYISFVEAYRKKLIEEFSGYYKKIRNEFPQISRFENTIWFGNFGLYLNAERNVSVTDGIDTLHCLLEEYEDGDEQFVFGFD